MKACGHSPDPKRVGLYLDLVREETGELEQAMAEFYAAETNKTSRWPGPRYWMPSVTRFGAGRVG